MNSAEGMSLMLNVGWSLAEIAIHYDLPVAVVKLMIVAHVKAERLTAQLLASGQS